MSEEEMVFEVVCQDCGYVFYTPDDDIDYCPHCGSENINKRTPLPEEPYFIVKKVMP